VGAVEAPDKQPGKSGLVVGLGGILCGMPNAELGAQKEKHEN
jgi:hypothetical protein